MIKITSFLCVIFAFLLISGFIFQFSRGGAQNNLSGYAWSSNAGWISFNCTNPPDSCGQVDYGVDVDSSTGNFSGYAWSSNIGWIDFAPAGPYPPSGIKGVSGYSAKMDLLTGKASGWARVLSLTGFPGGGWMNLSGVIPSSCAGMFCPPELGNKTYGAQADQLSGQFSGWSWEPDVVGWVNWSGVSGNSLFSPPCTADTWICTDWSSCSGSSQTRSCNLTSDCSAIVTPSPATSQSCVPAEPLSPSNSGFKIKNIKEVTPN